MKRLRYFLLLPAAASLAPLANANAPAENFVAEAQSGYFQQVAAMPKMRAPTMPSNMHVVQNSMGWTYFVYDNPPPGAQGPIREEINPQAGVARAQSEALWQSLAPIDPGR